MKTFASCVRKRPHFSVRCAVPSRQVQWPASERKARLGQTSEARNHKAGDREGGHRYKPAGLSDKHVSYPQEKQFPVCWRDISHQHVRALKAALLRFTRPFLRSAHSEERLARVGGGGSRGQGQQLPHPCSRADLADSGSGPAEPGLPQAGRGTLPKLGTGQLPGSLAERNGNSASTVTAGGRALSVMSRGRDLIQYIQQGDGSAAGDRRTKAQG